MTVALRRSWAKDLDAATLYELLKLRVEVFVVEQAPRIPSWTAATCPPKHGTSGWKVPTARSSRRCG